MILQPLIPFLPYPLKLTTCWTTDVGAI